MRRQKERKESCRTLARAIDRTRRAGRTFDSVHLNAQLCVRLHTPSTGYWRFRSLRLPLCSRIPRLDAVKVQRDREDAERQMSGPFDALMGTPRH